MPCTNAIVSNISLLHTQLSPKLFMSMPYLGDFSVCCSQMHSTLAERVQILSSRRDANTSSKNSTFAD